MFGVGVGHVFICSLTSSLCSRKKILVVLVLEQKAAQSLGAGPRVLSWGYMGCLEKQIHLVNSEVRHKGSLSPSVWG